MLIVEEFGWRLCINFLCQFCNMLKSGFISKHFLKCMYEAFSKPHCDPGNLPESEQPFRWGWQLGKLCLSLRWKFQELCEGVTHLQAHSWAGASGSLPMVCPPSLSLFEKEVETNRSYSLTGFRNWAPPFGSVRLSSWQRFTQSSLCGSAISFAVESTIILSLPGPCLSQFLGAGGIMLDLQKSIASKSDTHIINAVCTVEENVGKVIKATIRALHEDVQSYRKRCSCRKTKPERESI